MTTSGPDIERYVDAMLAVAGAVGALDRLERELPLVQEVVSRSDTRRFFSDPFVANEGKSRAVGQLLADKVHPALLYFLCILAAEDVLRFFDSIAERTFAKLAAMRDELAGELISAAPLSEDRLRLVETEVGRCLRKKVSLRARVDPNIVGGIIVRAGDFLLDGSIGHQLDNARLAILGR
ncbi:MAG: ATP synthase F1 subunit delta [Lentisphaerales bacterium]|nr:MAG: ATP synthase F1 subunit delta [Lentisphaerales bacterium]